MHLFQVYYERPPESKAARSINSSGQQRSGKGSGCSALNISKGSTSCPAAPRGAAADAGEADGGAEDCSEGGVILDAGRQRRPQVRCLPGKVHDELKSRVIATMARTDGDDMHQVSDEGFWHDASAALVKAMLSWCQAKGFVGVGESDLKAGISR
jgi:hypothetical protein